MSRVSLASFIAAVVLFVLPWVSISCGGQALVTMSGLDLAVGKNVAPPMEGLEMKSEPVRKWEAGAALVLGVGAVAVAFLVKNVKTSAGLRVLFGIAGGVLLLLLQRGEKPPGNEEIPISIDFQIGYWLAVAAFFVGAITSVLMLKEGDRAGAPPRAGAG